MKTLAFILLAFCTLALPAHAQTTSVSIPTPDSTHGSITIVAIMGQGTTCTTASPCVFTWSDTFSNWQQVGVWAAPFCQAANLIGSPPVPTLCTGLQDFGWAAKTMVNGIVQNGNNAAKQAAIAATSLPTPAAPAAPGTIPNCGGTC